MKLTSLNKCFKRSKTYSVLDIESIIEEKKSREVSETVAGACVRDISFKKGTFHQKSEGAEHLWLTP
jgi:hypothetical protein